MRLKPKPQIETIPAKVETNAVSDVNCGGNSGIFCPLSMKCCSSIKGLVPYACCPFGGNAVCCGGLFGGCCPQGMTCGKDGTCIQKKKHNFVSFK